MVRDKYILLLEEISKIKRTMEKNEENLYNTQRQIVDLKHEKVKLEQEKLKIEIEIENQVYFQPDLKNQQQREAKLKELLYQNEKYLKISLKLPELDKRIKELEAKAEYYRRDFSIQKRLFDFYLKQLELLAKED